MNIVRAVDARVDLSPPTMVVFESVPSVQFQQIPPSQPSNNPVITIPITPGFGLGRSPPGSASRQESNPRPAYSRRGGATAIIFNAIARCLIMSQGR